MKKVFGSIFFAVFSAFSLLFFGEKIGSNLKHSSYSASACFFNKYSSNGAEYNAKDIDSIDISWIGGEVNILESEKDVLFFKEDSHGKELSENQKLHWCIEKGKSGKGKLIIEPEDPSISNKWSWWKKSLPKKDLTVYVPKNLERVSLNIVGSVCDFKESTAKKICLSGVGGSLNLAPLNCDKVSVNGTSLDLNIKLNDTAGYTVCRDGVFDGLIGKDEKVYGDGKIKISLEGVKCRLKTL